MGRDGLPAVVEGVRGEFASWRSRRRRGERIPQRLWESAVRAAQQHGVHRVSRVLGVDYLHLRRRVSEAGGKGTGAGSEAVFVELSREASGTDVGCVVELEKANGTRMRICVREASVVDWCRMKEAFLGA